MTTIDKIYPLAIVDDVLEAVGLPKTKPLLDAVSPDAVLGGKLGLTAPGEIIEGAVEDVSNDGFMRNMPKLPGMR